MRVPESVHLEPYAADLRERIAALPAGAGIYALSVPGKQPHVAWSANLPRRLLRLLVSSYTGSDSLMARLRSNLAAVECWPTGSRLESSLLSHALMKRYFPENYLIRLRLRMPWFVGLTTTDRFPRLTVVNRISRRSGPLFGPFQNREAAQQYEQELLALFQIRRCTEILQPAAEHPGCIYGEMNQCLRPCQCAVTVEEYGSEAQRAGEFLSTNGRSAIAMLSGARDRAANETDFEQAAHIHKRIEKMKAAAAARDEVITEIHQFNGVALTRGGDQRQFRLWLMAEGCWQEPVTLELYAENASTMSLDRELRDRLEQALAASHKEGKRVEDLAIFSRWYYSSWRDGEWFPFRTLADLNYRRLVRGISKLVKAGATSSA